MLVMHTSCIKPWLPTSRQSVLAVRTLSSNIWILDASNTWEEVAELLYVEVKDKVSVFHVATLYHSVTSALGIPRSLSSLTTAASEEAVHSMAMSVLPQEKELDDLCHYIHAQEFRELTPVQDME